MHLEDDGTACSARVEGLKPGTRYLFRVSAVNAEGSSDHSEVGEALHLAAGLAADSSAFPAVSVVQNIGMFCSSVCA